jgi:alkylresorcinol/alkylpyrone synthase
MSHFPRILAVNSATPPHHYDQQAILAVMQSQIYTHKKKSRHEQAADDAFLTRVFATSQVEHRQSAIDLTTFYQSHRSTGERMAVYRDAACTLGKAALSMTLAATAPTQTIDSITDFFVISCTGYTAPGLDILLARDLGMARDIRRVAIGHMGCYGALVGLRQSLAAIQANPQGVAAMLCVELSSLHFMPSDNPDALTSFALFGDAAAALVLGFSDTGDGPEVVSTYCAADFDASDQMSWTITDEGFIMGLSPRVPVTLRRTIVNTVEHLLAPHGLLLNDITHWLIHPGGPNILDVIQQKLELTNEQMALSWSILREHGNCSSVTVLLILEALLQSRKARQGEWGVMMAFGPGLTLELCLLRF